MPAVVAGGNGRAGRRRFMGLGACLGLLGCAGCARTRPAASAGATASAGSAAVRLINPTGPVVIPVAGIAGGTVTGEVEVSVSYWQTIDQVVGLLAAGDAEFAVLPVTVAANLVASDVDLVLLGVHEWRAFYLIAQAGRAFDGWGSLVGTTVYSPEAKGQTVDMLARYALGASGLDPDRDVTFVYAPAQEIVALFSEGRAGYAALPEPFVTQALAAGEGSVVLDYQDYWAEVSGAEHGIPIAGLFATGGCWRDHRDEAGAVADMLAASTRWANANPDAAIAASAEVLPLPAPVLRQALQRLGFRCVPAWEAKAEVLAFLNAVEAVYPEGIKAVPGDAFFAEP